jgi:CheY-specific phosphatase CheX
MTPSAIPADARPVAGSIREQIVEPFIQALQLTLTEMASIDAIVRCVYQTRAPGPLEEVAVMVELSGATPESLTLGFPQKTAMALAERILSGVSESVSESLVADCAAEIANVVAGHAKTALAATPYRFTCSLPRAVTGPTQPAAREECPECAIVVLDCAMGQFTLRLSFAA